MLANPKRPLPRRRGTPFLPVRRAALPCRAGLSHDRAHAVSLAMPVSLAGSLFLLSLSPAQPAWAQGGPTEPAAIISPEFEVGASSPASPPSTAPVTTGAVAPMPPVASSGSIAPATKPRMAPDYATHRRNLNARKMSGMEELRLSARGLVGRAVELEGEVKGSFLRANRLAVLFATRDGQMLTLDIPEQLAGNPNLRPGGSPQLLLKVDGVMGQDVALSVVNVTTAVPSGPLENDPGAPVVLTPMTTAPNPGGTIVYDDGPILAQVRPQPSLIPKKQSASTAAPADPGQRAVYRALAKRFNPRLPDDMADYIAASLLTAAAESNLDPRFLAAVVAVESNFNPYSLSSSGAMGLGQIMPFNLRGLGITNAWDPMQNLRGSARMLRSNLDRFGGKPNATLLAVAAYHAGGNAVARAGHQVPNKAATQNYVWKVYYAYKSLAPELFQ